MDQTQKNEILKLINELEGLDTKPLAHSSTESRSRGIVETIVTPLLAEEGYNVKNDTAADHAADFLAERRASEGYKPCSICVQHKHIFHGQLDVNTIEQALFSLRHTGFDRVLVIANGPFSAAAHESARRAAPGTLELLDVGGLRAWVGRIDVESDINRLEIEQILKVVRASKIIDALSITIIDGNFWRHTVQVPVPLLFCS